MSPKTLGRFANGRGGSLQLGRHALALLAAGAVLNGCARGAASAGAAALVPAVTHPGALSSDAWRGSLLYVGGDQQTYVFRYPGGKPVATIPTGSFGMCSDAQGDVFLTHVGSIEQYAHGATTPVSTIQAPGTVYSCAVDPTTGNLAAVVFCLSGCGDSVLVYSRDGLPPKRYRDKKLRSMLFCGFDPSGNLYVDGYDGKGTFNLAKLPAHRHAFKNFTFGQNIEAAGQVQWDGAYMTVETRFMPQIYRLKVSRSTGTIVGSTQLTGSGERASQSWIQGDTVILPTGPQRKRPKIVLMWKYPKAGHVIRAIKGFIPRERMIDGVTVSVAPKG